MNLGRTHSFELAGDVQGFQIAYFWHPPPPPGRGPNTRPSPVTLIERSENSLCWGLPQGIDVALQLHDEGALDRGESTEFVESVVFRGRTSPLPEELATEFLAKQGR